MSSDLAETSNTDDSQHLLIDADDSQHLLIDTENNQYSPVKYTTNDLVCFKVFKILKRYWTISLAFILLGILIPTFICMINQIGPIYDNPLNVQGKISQLVTYCPFQSIFPILGIVITSFDSSWIGFFALFKFDKLFYTENNNDTRKRIRILNFFLAIDYILVSLMIKLIALIILFYFNQENLWNCNLTKTMILFLILISTLITSTGFVVIVFGGIGMILVVTFMYLHRMLKHHTFVTSSIISAICTSILLMFMIVLGYSIILSKTDDNFSLESFILIWTFVTMMISDFGILLFTSHYQNMPPIINIMNMFKNRYDEIIIHVMLMAWTIVLKNITLLLTGLTYMILRRFDIYDIFQTNWFIFVSVSILMQMTITICIKYFVLGLFLLGSLIWHQLKVCYHVILCPPRYISLNDISNTDE